VLSSRIEGTQATLSDLVGGSSDWKCRDQRMRDRSCTRASRVPQAAVISRSAGQAELHPQDDLADRREHLGADAVVLGIESTRTSGLGVTYSGNLGAGREFPLRIMH
jgi:hypothetical protein